MKTVSFFSALFSLMFLFSSCGELKPDNVELTILVSFPGNVTCKTYLADHFAVTLYDSEQKKKDTKIFDCTADTEELVLYVEKDSYYLTVALKGTDNLNKSYGSGMVDLSNGDAEVKIEMAEYMGGITFKWRASDCSDYNIHNLKFSLENEDGFVSSVIWGKEEKIENFEILCSAEMLEIVNIPAVLYTAAAKGFRTSDSKIPRIIYTVPFEFKVVSGQDVPVNINEYREVVVSDLKLGWEFDSKSVGNCETASVQKVAASLIGGSDTFSQETLCDNSYETFYFYDISAGDYEILVRGFNSTGETNFEGSNEIKIEKGKIGSDIISETIFLKEK